MANTDQNITELPIKTSSEVLDEDYMLGIDLVEGYQVTTKDFADYAVNRAAISIGGKTQTTASAISEVRTTAGNAQPKESGKGLSANDFTNAYKSKLDGIAAGAEVNVQSDWNASSGDAAILHKPTTISGYGITDAYTKTQVDTSLAAKSDKSTTYTKTEVDDIVNVDEDTSEAANPLVIETDAAQYAKATHLTLAPVQDLHGYDHPWPAGGGKNKYGNGDQSFTQAKQNIALLTPLSAGTYQFSAVVTSTDTDNVDCLIQLISASGITLASGRIGRGTRRSISLSWSGDDAIKINFYAAASYANGAGDTATFEDIQIEEGSTATSYEPYSNICPITPMGHRNLLAPQSIADPFVSNGITFIVNADGSVTVNGTASGNTWLLIGTANLTAGERYVLTGGIDAGRMMQLTDYPVVNSKGFDSGSSGLIFTAEANVVYGVRAYIARGVTVNNETLYPMLRPASDPDSTFVPYGMARVGAKVTGKNLIPMVLNDIKASNTGGTWSGNAYTYRGITATVNIDGDKVESISLSGTTSATFTFYLSSANANNSASFLSLFKDEEYKISGGATNIRVMAWLYNASRTFITNINSTGTDVSIPANTYDYYTPLIEISNGVTVNTTIYPMLRLASVTDSTFEPYTESASSLDLPETVYGGTLDLETGEVVADMGMVDLGTLNWTYTSGNSSRMSTPFTQIKNDSTTGRVPVNAICSEYMIASSNDIYEHNQDKTIGHHQGLQQLWVYDSAYTDAAVFKTAMSGVQLCYELATPITYQLTPQQLALFKGINNVSTNAKTVQVTYRNGELATTGNIVDAVEVAKQNAIGESASYTDARLATELAPILGNFATAETSPASASHAVGEYLLYNGNLYKVLAAISAGQQLTIGTNIGQTNVAAELASLNARYEKRIIYPNISEDVLVSVGQIWILIINWGSYSNMYNIENYSNGIYIKNMIVNSNITHITVSAITGGYRISNGEDSQCTAVAFRIA